MTDLEKIELAARRAASNLRNNAPTSLEAARALEEFADYLVLSFRSDAEDLVGLRDTDLSKGAGNEQ